MKVNNWISVEDRPPKNGNGVLVSRYNKKLKFSITNVDNYMGYGKWWNRNYDNEVWQITHWMPLPEDPQIINVKGDILESIEKVVKLLENLGVRVTTDNGDYRPTYDVLLDISKLVFGKDN